RFHLRHRDACPRPAKAGLVQCNTTLLRRRIGGLLLHSLDHLDGAAHWRRQCRVLRVARADRGGRVGRSIRPVWGAEILLTTPRIIGIVFMLVGTYLARRIG